MLSCATSRERPPPPIRARFDANDCIYPGGLAGIGVECSRICVSQTISRRGNKKNCREKPVSRRNSSAASLVRNRTGTALRAVHPKDRTKDRNRRLVPASAATHEVGQG